MRDKIRIEGLRRVLDNERKNFLMGELSKRGINQGFTVFIICFSI